MVSPKKVRLQITIHKDTLVTIDNLIKRLEKENPLVPYTRSSVLEGAFIAQLNQIIQDYEGKNQKNKEEEKWKF